MRSLFHVTLTLMVFLISFLSLSSIILADQTPVDSEYTIGVGDILKIQVWGNEDLDRIVEVSREGAFTFPLIGKVHALNTTVFGLERLLRRKLGNGYLVAPQVTVTLSEYRSQKVFVFGEVRKPGTYILKGKTSLLQLIADAGGLSAKAGRRVKIVRPSSPRPVSAPMPLQEASDSDIITIDLSQLAAGTTPIDSLVVNGDSIYVSQVSRMFVVGEVKSPGEFEWEEGITVRQAISVAGGASVRGAPGRTEIVRIVNGKEKKFKPGMNDPVLPNDVIRVPESYF